MNLSYADEKFEIHRFRRKLLNILIGLVFATAMIATGLDVKAAPGGDKQQTQSESAASGGTTDRAAQTGTEQAHHQLLKASDVIGSKVRSNDGNNKDAGEVKDMALDLPSGRIDYVVLSVGGLLKDNKLVAVPPQAIRMTRDGKEMQLVMSSDKVKQLPTLPEKDWAAALDQQTLNTMYQTAGVQSPKDWGANTRLVKITDLLGNDVIGQDQNGAKLADIAIDLIDGYAPYAILAGPGGVAGLKTKLVAVPTPALSMGNSKPNELGRERDKVRLSSTVREVTSGSPALDKDWPKQLDDRSLGGKMYATFGLQPYWTATGNAEPRALGGTREPSSQELDRRSGK